LADAHGACSAVQHCASCPGQSLSIIHRGGRVRFTFTGQVLNLLNNADDDIEYFYTSRLQSEPASGVNDFHIHPMEPRTWRFGVRVSL
jgi:hypothetical protein